MKYNGRMHTNKNAILKFLKELERFLKRLKTGHKPTVNTSAVGKNAVKNISKYLK